ncbi:unnamed protein product [Mucor hiemalis]
MNNSNSQDGVTSQVTNINSGHIINTRDYHQQSEQLLNNKNKNNINASFDKNTTLQESTSTTTSGNISVNEVENCKSKCTSIKNNNAVINKEQNESMDDNNKMKNNIKHEQSEWKIAGFKKYYFNKRKMNNVDNNNKSTSSFNIIKSNNNFIYKYRVSKHTYLYCSKCDNYGHTKGKCEFRLNTPTKQLKEEQHLHNNNYTTNKRIDDQKKKNTSIKHNNIYNNLTTNEEKDEDIIIILPTSSDDDYTTTTITKSTSSSTTTATTSKNKDSELLLLQQNYNTTTTSSDEVKNIINNDNNNASQDIMSNIASFKESLKEKDENELCGITITTETVESTLKAIESRCPNYRQDRYLFRTYLLLLVHKRANLNEHAITFDLLNRIKNFVVDYGLINCSGEQDSGGRIMSSQQDITTSSSDQ